MATKAPKKIKKINKTNKTNKTTGFDLVFTDGSTVDNGRPNAKGGIGCYFPRFKCWDVAEPFYLSPVTNIRCELMAAIRAINSYLYGHTDVLKRGKLLIYTDNQYMINCMNKWIHSWMKRGWKTSDGKAVKNQDLLKWLYNLVNNNMGCEIKFEFVRAHTNEPAKSSSSDSTWDGNDIADKNAKNGMCLSQ